MESPTEAKHRNNSLDNAIGKNVTRRFKNVRAKNIRALQAQQAATGPPMHSINRRFRQDGVGNVRGGAVARSLNPE